MSITWKCDLCGKSTHINPPTRPVTEIQKIKIQVPDMENGCLKDKFIEKEVPKTAKMKRQNSHTGKIEEVEIPDIEDLEPRNYMVQLSVGNERIQKDFCKECLEKHIKKDVQTLWERLNSIESK